MRCTRFTPGRRLTKKISAPDPVEPWVDACERTVIEDGACAGLVTDGDADRIGAVDERGRYIHPHQIMALVLGDLVQFRNLEGRVVVNLSCSTLVRRIAEALGCRVTVKPVGFKYIAAEMKKGGVLMGGEEAGGIGIAAHMPERDGILACLILCELMAKTDAPLGVLVDQLEDSFGKTSYGRRDLRLEAEAATFSYLAEKRRLASIETLLRLSRLPRREPKTFEGFDFSRIQGRDAAALGKLPSLADLYAHRNVAFVGPGGIGKTHLAQAYGRECCMRGLKTYYIKATELRDRFQKAVQRGNTSRVVSSLVKPSCLIVDEVGRCVYDRPCTDLFFDVVDRRYEKEGPNAMVLTSNIAPSGWDEFFTGDDTLLCALDRLFDKASVFVMRGPSYRGRELDTYSVEAVPQAVKVRGIQPEGM